MMEVHINGQPYQIPEEGKIGNALEAFQLEDTGGIAVAVNDQVVPKTRWKSYRLRREDKITVIRAAQGG